MSGLTDDEITVIAQHRRMPTIVAVEVGHALRNRSGIAAVRGAQVRGGLHPQAEGLEVGDAALQQRVVRHAAGGDEADEISLA